MLKQKPKSGLLSDSTVVFLHRSEFEEIQKVPRGSYTFKSVFNIIKGVIIAYECNRGWC